MEEHYSNFDGESMDEPTTTSEPSDESVSNGMDNADDIASQLMEGYDGTGINDDDGMMIDEVDENHLDLTLTASFIDEWLGDSTFWDVSADESSAVVAITPPAATADPIDLSSASPIIFDDDEPIFFDSSNGYSTTNTATLVPPSPSCTVTPEQSPVRPPAVRNDNFYEPIEVVSLEIPDQWDFCGCERKDPLAHNYTDRMRTLVSTLESMSSVLSEDDIDYYMAIQKNFRRQFDSILRKSCSPYAYDISLDPNKVVRMSLNSLYRGITSELHELISSRVNGNNGHNMVDLSRDSPIVVPSATFHNEVVDLSQSVSTGSGSKKDFVNYMTSWLRDNWTNPYNDEEGLQQMAMETGTSVDVISNWLINARTRKWRPALRKALALNRPADFLLEDSINIFDRKPIRELTVDEIQSYRNRGRLGQGPTPIKSYSSYPSTINYSSQHYSIYNQPLNTTGNGTFNVDHNDEYRNERIKSQYY